MYSSLISFSLPLLSNSMYLLLSIFLYISRFQPTLFLSMSHQTVCLSSHLSSNPIPFFLSLPLSLSLNSKQSLSISFPTIFLCFSPPYTTLYLSTLKAYKSLSLISLLSISDYILSLFLIIFSLLFFQIISPPLSVNVSLNHISFCG